MTTGGKRPQGDSEKPAVGCLSVVANLKTCCALGDVPHTSPEMRIRHESCIKNVEPSGRLFQVQTTSEPAAARAISRRTRFEGEASADEAYSPGSGAVQVSGRWKRAILCPTTRPVRKTHKSGCETRTANICRSILAVRSPLTLSELRTARKNCTANIRRSRTDLTWPSAPTR